MLDAVWGEVRRQLRACLFAKDFDTWIAPLRATCFEAGELTIEVPSAFGLEWLREHHLDALTQAVEGAAGQGTRLKLVVNRTLEAEAPARRPVRRAESAPLETVALPTPRCTFDTFVVGRSNEVAWRGARAGSFRRFTEDFPEAKIIRLEQNYRSTQTILDAAAAESLPGIRCR